MKGRTAYQGRAALDFRNSQPVVHVAVNIPNGRAEDLVEVLAPAVHVALRQPMKAGRHSRICNAS